MNADDLLLWLSAKGSGTWSRYRAAIDEMETADELSEEDTDPGDTRDSQDLPVHHRLRLNLERLGHVEFFRKEFPNGWRVVPPTLACSTDPQGATGILCGARTEHLLARIRNAAADIRIAAEQHECPDRIEIVASDQRQLEQIASHCNLKVQREASRTLLAAIPPVDDWQLRTPVELPFGNDWQVKRFSAHSLDWMAGTASEARSASFGLYRFQTGYQPQYYLQARGRSHRLPVQVGKYIVLRKARRRVVSYDPASGIFAVPVSCRPPLLVDRALTLCEGLIPRFDRGQLVYHSVSKTVALTTAALLKQ